MTFKINLDYKSYFSKPKDAEIGALSNRIASQTKQLNPETVGEFVEAVGIEGRTFTPATFKGNRKRKENFEQMQLFALDFDNDRPGSTISFQKAKERADTYNLPVLFAYESFNSRDKDRFRMVFLNDTPIKEARNAELILNALAAIFPECDPGSKEINRMYFGGRKEEALFFDQELPQINIVSAVTGMTNYLEDKYSTNYKREVSKFIRDNKLAANSRGMPDVSVAYALPKSRENAESFGAHRVDEISPNSTICNNKSISIIEGFGEKSSKKYYLILFSI